MANKQSRYQQMARYMTYALIADGVLFFLYLLCAGFGVIWLKVILAILAILLSGLCIAYLYLTQELLRPRSQWMSVSFVAVVICIVVSLILNYPSPNPLKKNAAAGTSAAASSSQSSTPSESGTATGDTAAYVIANIDTI